MPTILTVGKLIGTVLREHNLACKLRDGQLVVELRSGQKNCHASSARIPPGVAAARYIFISIAAATLRQPAIISSNCLNVIDW